MTERNRDEFRSESAAEAGMDDGASFVDRFHPNVIAFEHADDGEEPDVRGFFYCLRDDLRRLGQHQHHEDPVAIVFFCARILEVTVARAVRFTPRSVGIDLRDKTLDAYLRQLEKVKILPPTVATWAFYLRHLGNAVRHVTREITPTDGELSVAYLEGFLTWFFCDFEFQRACYRSDRLVDHGVDPPAFAVSDGVVELVHALDDGPPRLDRLLEVARDDPTRFFKSPAFATLTAHKLIAAQRVPEALDLLGMAIAAAPSYRRDWRLRQLMALAHSRLGDLDEAEHWLEDGPSTFLNDAETVGILGGIQKRRSLAEFDRSGRSLLAMQLLELAHRTYRLGWEASCQSNQYLGINAATTALLGVRRDSARRTATAISGWLSRQRGQVVTGGAVRSRGFDLWDELTLLEADLILGRVEDVGQRLRDLIASESGGRTADVEVFLAQARRILAALREWGEIDLPDDHLESLLQR